MKKMKRSIAFVLAVIMLFTVVGCKSADPQKSTEKEQTNGDISLSTQPESTGPVTETTENPPETTEMPTEPTEPESELNLLQRNSVEMLNYLAMVTQEIKAEKNNRLYLDEVYSMLANETNPETIDEYTMDMIESLMKTIQNYMIQGLAKERTKYMLEQHRANALLGAVPNSVLDSVYLALNYRELIESWDKAESIVSNLSSFGDAEADYLEAAWQLEDDELMEIYNSRLEMFKYRAKMVQEYQLPKELALKEEDVDDFVEWRKNTNNAQKIQHFESREDIYQNFGPFWLELSNCYFNSKEYERCLEAYYKYKQIRTTVLVKDYDFAKVLPHIIAAAQNVYEDSQCISFTENALNELLENAPKEDWMLKFIAAQTYIELYSKTQKSEYIEKAYSIILDNITDLAREQKGLNDVYMNDVVEIPEAAAETSDAKKQRKAYNDQIKETRKTELPPVFEPLTINCDLLFALIKEPGVGEINQAKIKGILSDSDEHVFMSEYLKEKYSFDYEKGTCKAEFLEDELVIPVTFLTDNSKIRVSVTEDGTTSVYEDWKINRVERRDASVSSFMAIFESEEISDQKWSDDSKVTVEILEEDASAPFVTMAFEVEDSTSYVLWTEYTFVQVQ